MQEICDLFIVKPTKSTKFRFIKTFSNKFEYHEEKYYCDYLGLNIPRLKLVPLVIELRKEGFQGYNVPIKYRDSSVISVEEAHILALESIKGEDECSITKNTKAGVAPLWHMFGLINNRAGGIVAVDKIDGHIWSLDEYEEYMYDYNCLI